jgi:hypothetical protein
MIHQFYDNKVVLLTGVTGFVGTLYRLLLTHNRQGSIRENTQKSSNGQSYLCWHQSKGILIAS